MFQHLRAQPDDALLSLIALFRDDPRPDRLDLGVGTYRDDQGRTPVMQVVKSAERHLLETQISKGYLGPEGDEVFVRLLQTVVFGTAEPFDGRLAGVQTPGGSGALRLGGELVARAHPDATLWLGTPTWPNHQPVMEASGLSVRPYRYFDVPAQALCFDAMLQALSGAQPGDVVLLHGCCHNPTGADLDEAQWDALAALLAERRLVPFLDLAYQGLGQGLDADAYGVRRVLAAVQEALVAYSCDKNFGLYRERTGALFVLAADRRSASVVQGNLSALARVNWSMPPDHGAAAVRVILEDAKAASEWRAELAGMCARIVAVREALAHAAPGLSFLARQRGMFSQLAMPPEAVLALRREHAIYVAPSGRINVAGLKVSDAGRLVDALAATGLLPASGGAQQHRAVA